MTEQTINELADFFRTFKQGETKQPPQSNLTYDDAVTYFFRNMEVRGLASETKHFYRDKLNAFRKFLVQIKKVQAIIIVSQVRTFNTTFCVFFFHKEYILFLLYLVIIL